MSRVMTFSRVFPSYHPKKSSQSNFVEKIHYSIWSSVSDDYIDMIDFIRDANKHLDRVVVNAFIDSLDMETRFDPKHHTIRAGHRWKVGDKFSPRVWSGKPYQSKQIIIAPDIEVKKVWDVRIDLADQYETVYILDENGDQKDVDESLLAKNDGLSDEDFYDWFDTPKNRKSIFKGQIIAWNENINY